jgi:hypothetical protein
MRSVIPAILVFLTVSAMPVCASEFDEQVPDQQSIAALESRASQAPAREQCFLYAQLVHQMTELSVRQYAAGNVDRASNLLRQVQEMTHKIHLSVSDNDKRLKNAEILLRHTAFRLTGLLHASSYEDQALVAQTLAQVNQVQNEAMMQVFRK